MCQLFPFIVRILFILISRLPTPTRCMSAFFRGADFVHTSFTSIYSNPMHLRFMHAFVRRVQKRARSYSLEGAIEGAIEGVYGPTNCAGYGWPLLLREQVWWAYIFMYRLPGVQQFSTVPGTVQVVMEVVFPFHVPLKWGSIAPSAHRSCLLIHNTYIHPMNSPGYQDEQDEQNLRNAGSVKRCLVQECARLLERCWWWRWSLRWHCQIENMNEQ